MKHSFTNHLQAQSMPRRSGGLETVFQIMLLVIGLGGVWYIRVQHNTNDDNPVITTDQVQLTKGDGTAPFLQIIGTPEAGATIHFEIPGFRKQDRYLLDTGWGKHLVLQGSSTEFVYPQPGYYEVKLWRKIDNQWCLVSKENLQVDNRIRVVSM